MPVPLPFIDLQAQRRRLGGRIEAAIARVLDHGQFIMGPEVQALEAALADYVGVRHAISCASGTDALVLPLMARGIGPGDAVFVPAFTFAATAEAPALVGATPVLVDVERETANLDPQSLAEAIAMVRDDGRLVPRAVIPVDLYGQPADYAAIGALARDHGLLVIQDAAQSFGARIDGRAAGAQGHVGATSFYPSKPLGGYGDGGAMFTDDDDLAAILRSLRAHGAGAGGAYDHQRLGLTGRLDTLQAAVLLEKLPLLDDEIAAREQVARRYGEGLGDLVEILRIRPGVRSAWAQYTLLVPERDRLRAELGRQGIPTAVHYPRPLNRQPAFAGCPLAPGGLGVAEALAAAAVSLPMHPYLAEADQARVVGAVRAGRQGQKGA
jgi:dTDP-4-amino-4,6-dideoxygalactose transaminase